MDVKNNYTSLHCNPSILNNIIFRISNSTTLRLISAAIFFKLVHFYFAHVSHCSPFRLSNGNGHIRLTFALKFPSLTIVSEVCGGDTSYDVSLHSSQNIYTEETPSCALSSRYFQRTLVTPKFLWSWLFRSTLVL